MALLNTKQRKARFKSLGLGEYNKENLLKFQKTAFPNNKKMQDGVYGTQTDNALRTFYNVHKCAPNFKPQEFRCDCGRCSGYPSFMRQVELKHLQRIRNHYKTPMKITCGLRCLAENKAVGGVPNSGHLRGYAADFYMKGVTDTIGNRTQSLKWIEKQPNHQFTYGAYMYDSEGKYRTAPGMGNAMHTECHKPVSKKKTAQKSKYYNATTIIGEARCNEKGTLSGGKPGDQTGKEVGMGSWYSGGWNYMFRAKDASIRDKLAQAMIDTCNNSNIGYNIDPPNRYAAWDNSEANGHKIAKISKKGDTTCSQAVSMCMRAVGIPKQYAPRHFDIATMTKVMKNSPHFTMFTSTKHTKGTSKLLPGDILLSSHHTVIVVKSPNAK